MGRDNEFKGVEKRVVQLGKDAGGQLSPQEHHEWAQRMWKRMDRNMTGTITRDELDCEEFRTIVRSALAPGKGNTGGASYERVSQNTQQAISFCLRKADLNSDGSLGFEEFSSFLWYLRQDKHAQHTAHLIFALFDLDGDMHLDEQEFREIYRFYLGHYPTETEFQEEWARLDLEGRDSVMLPDYVRWLQASTNPIFQQHAPEEVPSRPDSGGQEVPFRAGSRAEEAHAKQFSGKPQKKKEDDGQGRKKRSPSMWAGLGLSVPEAERLQHGGASAPQLSPVYEEKSSGGLAADLLKRTAGGGAKGSKFAAVVAEARGPKMSPTAALAHLSAKGLDSDFDMEADISDTTRVATSGHTSMRSEMQMRQTWAGESQSQRQRFHYIATANLNDVMPKGQRNYFSRPQSLPQLGRYHRTHRGFRDHRIAGAALPEEKYKSPVLSNYMETLMPERYAPGGTMKKRAGSKSKKIVQWEDNWQTPAYLVPRWKPGALDFADMGPPPSWMIHYKEECD